MKNLLVKGDDPPLFEGPTCEISLSFSCLSCHT